MKRSWIGLGLLVILLVLGLMSTRAMKKIHAPVAQQLTRAAEDTREGSRERGRLNFQAAKETWQAWENFRACFSDHTPVEEIDALFAQLEIYCAAREDTAFAAGCMELAEKVRAIGDAHGLVWWNIL